VDFRATVQYFLEDDILMLLALGKFLA